MEITYTEERLLSGEKVISASIDLHKLFGAHITGGTLYATGSSQDNARRNLRIAIQELQTELDKI